MAVTTNRVAIGRRVRAWLACIVSVATLSCGPKLVEDEKHVETRRLRRWTAKTSPTSASFSGCTQWTKQFPNPTANFDPLPAVAVVAKVGSKISYEDNLGLQDVTRSSTGTPLPETDGFWCSDFEQHRSGGVSIAGLDCLTVVGPSPAAAVEAVELVEPTTSDPSEPRAAGFRATLAVIGTGAVTLGVPESCPRPNAFPFSFTALVIEP